MAHSFQELQQQVFALYHPKHFEQALQLVQQALPSFPDKATRIVYWQACFLCLLNQPEQALGILQKGLDQGLWWSHARLTLDSDLASIQERPEFKTILEESARRKQNLQTSTKPKLRVFPLEHLGQTNPLLMAFHMKASNLEDTVPHWKSVVQRGVLLAALQSSQLEGPDEYCWDDPQVANQEVQNALTVLQTQHGFDPRAVVLGGASQGAGLAVRLTIQGIVPSRGFIAIVGAGAPDALLPHVNSAAQRGIRGVFITGEHDNARSHVEKVYGELKAAGLECQLEVVPGLDHNYPPDMSSRLERALEFILLR